MYVCGTEGSKCSGTLTNLTKMLGTGKTHATAMEAFTCHRSWLVSLGYTPVGSRALAPPGHGPIRVLTKPSRFGAVLRTGKEATRSMPMRRRGGYVGSM